QHDERPTPATLQLGQHLRRAEKTGHVYVVTTRVHHTHFHAEVVLRLYVARIRKTCLFFDREGIEFGSDEHCWPGAILQHAYDAIAKPLLVLILADAFSDRESEFAQLTGYEGRRFFLAM